MRYHITLSLILFTLISGCSKTDNAGEANTTQSTSSSSQNALQAPVVENAPASTTKSSVTVTVRTLPNCDVYLGNEHVATADSEGIAYVTLALGEASTTQSFSFKIKENNRFSDTVVISIQRVSEASSVSSASSQSTSQTPTEGESNSAGVSSESVHVSSTSSSSVAVAVITTSSSAAASSQGLHVSSVATVSSASTSSTTTTNSEVSSSTPAVPANPLTTLTLTADTLELPEGNTTTLHVKATYKDTTTQTLASGLQWVVADASMLEITPTTLKALKEGSTTLKARYQSITSNPLHVTIYKEKDGHRLPPMPDEKINNSTLLGIDTNNNGVRDDVERWIYTRYNEYYPCDLGFYKIITDGKERYYTGEHILPEGISVLELIDDSGRHVVKKEDCAKTPTPYHRIVREIAMQGAKAAQIIIQEPEKARETVKIFDRAMHCDFYFRGYAKYNNEPILINHYLLGKEFKTKQFNTVKRVRAFGKYNAALSGGVYSADETPQEMRDSCDFNVTKLLEAGK